MPQALRAAPHRAAQRPRAAARYQQPCSAQGAQGCLKVPQARAAHRGPARHLACPSRSRNACGRRVDDAAHLLVPRQHRDSSIGVNVHDDHIAILHAPRWVGTKGGSERARVVRQVDGWVESFKHLK